VNHADHNRANGYTTGQHSFRWFTVTGEDFWRSIKWARKRGNELKQLIQQSTKSTDARNK
jgi:hypothetical protein